MSATRTARERVREELSAEILAVARDHLAREGAATLSLRSIARDLQMAPSALYRYFDGRDALLSALILAAYESLADEAERAAARAEEDGTSGVERWLQVPRAVRAWALAHPHEWALVFGTPVPGYEAPQDTIAPYERLAGALARPVLQAATARQLRTEDRDVTQPVASPELRAAVAPVADRLFPGLPAEVAVRALQAWTVIVGAISLELYGHWHNTVLDPELFFEAALRDQAAWVGLS